MNESQVHWMYFEISFETFNPYSMLARRSWLKGSSFLLSHVSIDLLYFFYLNDSKVSQPSRAKEIKACSLFQVKSQEMIDNMNTFIVNTILIFYLKLGISNGNNPPWQKDNSMILH